MKKKFFSVMTVAILLIASLVSAADIQGNGYIEVEGIKYYEPGKSLDELRRMAVMDGYRALAEALGDLRITSETTMKDLTELNDEVKVAVQKTVNGARYTVNRDSEGNFHSKIRLNLFGGANSLANIVVPQSAPTVQPFPSFDPKFVTIDSNYTGLIIDCSGQNLSTAVLPKIQSVSGKEVYAFQYLDRNIVVGRGMVNYSDSANSGTQRAGNNPLTVQAMFVQGECDVVVSDEDADKILAANSKSNFLKNCMVVFVK